VLNTTSGSGGSVDGGGLVTVGINDVDETQLAGVKVDVTTVMPVPASITVSTSVLLTIPVIVKLESSTLVFTMSSSTLRDLSPQAISVSMLVVNVVVMGTVVK